MAVEDVLVLEMPVFEQAPPFRPLFNYRVYERYIDGVLAEKVTMHEMHRGDTLDGRVTACTTVHQPLNISEEERARRMANINRAAGALLIADAKAEAEKEQARQHTAD